MLRVKHPQDFWSGALFMIVGLAALWFGRTYAFGTATRMGPGFLPTVLSWGLVLIGGFILLRGLVVQGPPIESSALRPQFMLVLAIVVFALMIERFGLAPAVFVVTIIAAMASSEMRWKETVPLAIGMAVVSIVLFIYLLGQSMQPWTWSF
ncbi:MAG: tctB4 [Hyphomicrobiales bacterium]|nr:tctB4 [Hyphomicrobiales bacterium]